jgi:hypothetical protein
MVLQQHIAAMQVLWMIAAWGKYLSHEQVLGAGFATHFLHAISIRIYLDELLLAL